MASDKTRVRFFTAQPPTIRRRARTRGACYRSLGRHGPGEVGDQMATGQEIDRHRSVRIRYLQGAGRRQTFASHRQGHWMSAGTVPDGRGRSRGKRFCFIVFLCQCYQLNTTPIAWTYRAFNYN